MRPRQQRFHRKQRKKKTLSNEIQELNQEIAEAHKSLNEATELREAEKAENEKTLDMAKGGKEAVESAISVLKDFYDSAAFLQENAPNADRDGNTVSDLAPETSFDDDYKGKQGASKGILGMLDVILSDFDRTLDTVGEEEDSAQTAHDEFETEAKKDISDKEDEKTTKEGDVTKAEDAITQAKDDLNEAENLQDGALEELAKLKPMCVEGEETYAERKKKREEEIAALKDAMKILEDWQS